MVFGISDNFNILTWRYFFVKLKKWEGAAALRPRLFRIVGGGRLELPRITPLAPKASAAANFATRPVLTRTAPYLVVRNNFLVATRKFSRPGSPRLVGIRLAPVSKNMKQFIFFYRVRPAGISPSPLALPPQSSGWAPPRLFCLLAKHDSGVRILTRAKQFARSGHTTRFARLCAQQDSNLRPFA